MSVTIGLFLLGSYLLGSLPFGLWITMWVKGVDVRTVGSGNIGATNVTRVCGPAVGRFVFTLDLLKGLIPPLIGRYLLYIDRPDSRWIVFGALLAVLGHNYSLFLKFQGGKGISTSGGALFGVAPIVAVADGIVFLIFLFASSTISLGSLAGALALPFLMIIFYRNDPYEVGFGVAAAAMAFYKHRKNIERLRAGTEPRVHLFGKRSPEPQPAEASDSSEGGAHGDS